MCGFVLLVHTDLAQGEREYICTQLRDSLAHRGPDDAGLWSSSRFPISLAHRRLSILDLSPLGHQPMSRSGRFTIIFNGEIYNFQEIRDELIKLGHAFRSNGDTEVLLAACEEFGVEECVKRCNGMFAFALWDEERQVLTLARDRLGKKPLFYGWHDSGFIAASELRAFLELPGAQWDLSREACGLYFQQNFFPPPYTPLRQVWKLLPGTLLELPAESLKVRPDSFSPFDEAYAPQEAAERRPRRFFNLWQEREEAQKSIQRSNTTLSDEEWVGKLHDKLSAAVARRMIADVPLGAFLSGGIDSSLICAIMQEQFSRPVETFTVRFDEQEMDEGEYAKEVAQILGTSHHELFIRYQDALDIVPKLPLMFDEPLGDASQIPTYLVSHFARQKVTVALSGDAGDELFGGYQRYLLAQVIGSRLRHLPYSLRKAFARSINLIPRRSWEGIFSALYRVLPAGLQIRRPAAKIGRFVELLCMPNASNIYRHFTMHWQDGMSIAKASGKIPHTLFETAQTALAHESDMLEIGTCTDILNWLTGDIFYKVDQASMATSLEARSPFCDSEIIRFALSLPGEMKQRNGKGKWILRQLLGRYFPEQLFERPKQGFMIPHAQWLRGPLRDWGEDLLDFGEESQVLNLASVWPRWHEHMSGEGSWEYHLWDVLQFLSWMKQWKSCLHTSSLDVSE